jgi:hypothetical protein
MRDETRDALKLFVEKTQRLRSSRYVRWLLDNRGTALLLSSKQEGGVTIQPTRPDEDATAAFVLTFRFFVQQNEHSSFLWLANHALDDPGLSEQWKQGLVRIRGELSAWLDRPTHQNKPIVETVTEGGIEREHLVDVVDDVHLTNRDIMEIFLYGDLAHANPGKKETFDRWKANPIWFSLVQLEFDKVLMGILPAIWHVARLSNQELSSQSNPSPLAS